jgi:hypothetical protein
MWEVTFLSSYKGTYDLEQKMAAYLRLGWEPVSFTHIVQGLGADYTVMLRRKKETK